MGEIFAIGISWRRAPVALRERVAFPDEDVPSALDELLTLPSVSEGMILSTCNRVEIYGAVTQGSATSAAAEASAFLSQSRGVDAETLSEALYEYQGVDAIEHLFRVASSVDSMVVGESQILGQVKEAYGVAVRANACGPILSRSMERAFSAAKRVRTETGVSRGAANVSTVAVDLARRVFGELEGKNVAIVGAGKMSALAARHLRAQGASSIYVTNRSPERGQALATEVEGTYRAWESIPELLERSDVVISSTGAGQPILTKKILRSAMRKRRYRSLLIVDIAVPRDVEPSVGMMDGVYLFNMDDLEKVVDRNKRERQREADLAVGILGEEIAQLETWLRSQRVVPTIRSLRKHFQTVADAEVEKAVHSLTTASDPSEGPAILRRFSQLLVNKLLHSPMTALKSGDDPQLDQLVEVTQRLFDLPGGAVPTATEARPEALKSAPSTGQGTPKKGVGT